MCMIHSLKQLCHLNENTFLFTAKIISAHIMVDQHYKNPKRNNNIKKNTVLAQNSICITKMGWKMFVFRFGFIISVKLKT